jgi:VWFA-related protein
MVAGGRNQILSPQPLSGGKKETTDIRHQICGTWPSGANFPARDGMQRSSAVRPYSIALLLFTSSITLTPATHGQNVPPPTLHTGANLVLVDVVVTDHGKPVLDLARSRFHVFEDGKEQSISSFDEHRPGTEPPAFLAPATLPPNTYTNVPGYPQSSALNVLLLDGLNTSIGNQMQVRHKMIEYLGTIKPGTTLAVFTLGTRLQIVTQFTNDPASLAALFGKSKTNPQQSPPLEGAESTAQVPSPQQPASAQAGQAAPNPSAAAAGPLGAAQVLQQFQADSSAFQIEVRTRITLEAMKQLASYLGGFPGRKNVIWFSGSFPLELLPDLSAPFPFANLRDYREDIQKTTDMLTAARVAIYPIDAHGLWVNTGISAAKNFVPPDHRSPLNKNPTWNGEHENRYAEEATMQQVADDTGGEAFLETNDFDKAVAHAIDDGASYYTLAYVPKNEAFDGKFRQIEVRLDDGHGLKLAHRRGYYADAPGSSPNTADQATSVFGTALAHDAPQATAILFKARVLPAADPAFQNVSLPVPTDAAKTTAFKGPAHRYMVDLTLDPHTLAYETMPNGDRKADVEFALIAYDANGQPLNEYTHAYQMGLKAAQYEHLLDTGISLRLPFDLPAGDVDLRIGIHDMNADRAGSLEVPLQVTGN